MVERKKREEGEVILRMNPRAAKLGWNERVAMHLTHAIHEGMDSGTVASR